MAVKAARGSRLLRSAVAGATIVAAAVFFTPGVASASPAQASLPVDASKLVWLTPEQHAALTAKSVGSLAGTASVARAATDIPALPNDPPNNPYQVLYSYSDLRGTYTPIRRGNNAFGYNHYAYEHNLTNPNPIRAAFQTHKPDVEQGAHLEYISLLTDPSNGAIYLTVRVVVQAASQTDDRKWRTPDGTNIGVITAFCQGYNVCPAWANG